MAEEGEDQHGLQTTKLKTLSFTFQDAKKFLHTTTAENKSFTHEQEKKNAT